MQAIIFIGIQATGKTTFYLQHFINTHVRISLDLLKTRYREKRFLETCIQTQQRFVVDNTNPTVKERERYIQLAREAHFDVIGYYFKSQAQAAIDRNNTRIETEQIPLSGILGTYKKLELPSYGEGFDELYYVEILENDGFKVERWIDEI